MRLFISVLCFTLLVNVILPALAADPKPGQPVPAPKPPLKILGTKQEQPAHPSPPLSLPGQRRLKSANETIRDILGPLTLPESKTPWIPITIGVILLLLLGLFFIFRTRKKKTAPLLPAHEIALAELAKAKAWMTKSKGLLYAQRLSDILRRYIESRFFVQSTRQTTDELLNGLLSGSSSAKEIQPHLDDLQTCLEQCDMAKFAHLPPDGQMMTHMESAVRHFIETTRPVQQTGDAA